MALGKLGSGAAALGFMALASSTAVAENRDDPIGDLIRKLELEETTVAELVVKYQDCVKTNHS